jgi:predicted TIM-barrel fold metal-dependent hydrolase
MSSIGCIVSGVVWVERMLVDCDIHVGYETLSDLLPYLDAPTRELVRSSGTNGVAMPSYPWNHPGDFPYLTLETLRERHLDPYDVTLGIVEPDEAAAFAVLPNAQLAARLAAAYNDWLLERWLLEESRLRGILVVPAQWPEAAAAEIRRLGGREEFVGVFLPGAARIPYGNPVYDPIWRAVADTGLAVAIHTHFESVGIAGPVTAAGMPDHYAEYHTLCGSGMYGHLISILCHGIFERFPGTRVAMVEGGLVPFVGFLWRLDTNWKACRSEMPGCRLRPSEYVWEHVRFATQPLESPDDPVQLVRAIEFLRPEDTLMYASDFPHWDFDEPEQTLRQLPAEWRDGVRWRNAARFFRLRVLEPA